jgi:hypothetical protein
MIEATRHGDLRMLLKTVTAVIKSAQSIVTSVGHKKIYCKPAAYR